MSFQIKVMHIKRSHLISTQSNYRYLILIHKRLLGDINAKHADWNSISPRANTAWNNFFKHATRFPSKSIIDLL